VAPRSSGRRQMATGRSPPLMRELNPSNQPGMIATLPCCAASAAW
jgi:hypothetical protein